jgi:curved DNA-binding protein
MQYKDYYQILGVDKKASAEDIKKAYKKLAKKHHPDVNKDKGSEAKFKDLSEAYEVLSDKDKRHKYDTLGANWDQYSNFGGANYNRYQDTGDINGNVFTGSDFSDFFEIFFGGKSDSFGGFGGFGGSQKAKSRTRQNPFTQQQTQQKAPPPQEDKITEIEVSVSEAYNGGSRVVTLDHGYGNKKDIKVNIPKGVEQGTKIRIPVQGQDIYFKIKIKENGFYKLDKKDVTCEIPVTDYEAVLGTEVLIPTISGSSINLKIPPQTQSGKTFRLKGLGMPDRKTEQKGDMYVKVKILLPKNLTEKEIELFTTLKELRKDKDNIREGLNSSV